MPESGRGYLKEGLVIVASILIAFALDASWDRYQEHRDEQRILGELSGEMTAARQKIQVSIGELEAVLATTRALFESLGPDTPALPRDSAVTLLKGLLSLNTLEVPQSTLNSVIASGRLGLLDDREIRQRLAEWPVLVEDVRENHDWHRTETDERLIPAMAPYVSPRTQLDQYLQAAFSEGAPVEQDAVRPGPSRFQLNPEPLQRDPEFEGLLAGRYSRQLATLVESYTLLEATEELIRLIDGELGDG